MLLRLVRESDVLLEGFRPGVMERLGVGYERLKQENPRLVYCAITGYGQDGPYRDRSGHDMNYLGLVGLLGLTGEAGVPPVAEAALRQPQVVETPPEVRVGSRQHLPAYRQSPLVGLLGSAGVVPCRPAPADSMPGPRHLRRLRTDQCPVGLQRFQRHALCLGELAPGLQPGRRLLLPEGGLPGLLARSVASRPATFSANATASRASAVRQ